MKHETTIDVHIRRVDTKEPPLPPPNKQRLGDAGIDLSSTETFILQAGERRAVSCGYAFAIPEGFCGLVVGRSGLRLNQGVSPFGGVGVVDSGYRGPVFIILHNGSDNGVHITRGQRIAQLLIQEAPTTSLIEVKELPEAIDDRGHQGFGSSGA